MIYLSKLKVVEKDGYKYAVPYFPIGYIYISVSNENPTNHFGGTWVSFGAGKVIVGVDTSQTEFNTVEKTGGEKTHTLTINELPTTTTIFSGTNEGNFKADYVGTVGNMIADKIVQVAHNNLQPYITVYMFKKIA